MSGREVRPSLHLVPFSCVGHGQGWDGSHYLHQIFFHQSSCWPYPIISIILQIFTGCMLCHEWFRPQWLGNVWPWEPCSSWSSILQRRKNQPTQGWHQRPVWTWALKSLTCISNTIYNLKQNFATSCYTLASDGMMKLILCGTNDFYFF